LSTNFGEFFIYIILSLHYIQSGLASLVSWVCSFADKLAWLDLSRSYTKWISKQFWSIWKDWVHIVTSSTIYSSIYYLWSCPQLESCLSFLFLGRTALCF